MYHNSYMMNIKSVFYLLSMAVGTIDEVIHIDDI